MKKLLTSICTLFCLFSLIWGGVGDETFAQNKTIDSLKAVILTAKEDTQKVNTLNKLSRLMWNADNYLQAKKMADDALFLSQNINYEKGKADAHINFSFVYYSMGNYPEALKNSFIGLKLSENIGYKQGIANAHNTIGIVLTDENKYPEALKEHCAALKIREEIGDKRGIASSHHNIGNNYHEQGNYPEALREYFISLKVFQEIGSKGGCAATYSQIGRAYYRQGDYLEAIDNSYTAIKLCEEIGNKEEMIRSYISIGASQVKMKNAAEGKDWLNKGLILAKEIGNKVMIKESYNELAEAYSMLGDFRAAYESHKSFTQVRDSLYNEEATKIKMQYEFDKVQDSTKTEQEKKDILVQKDIQKQKLVRNGFIAGFAIVLLFAVVFFRQRNKTKKEQKRSEDLLLNILPGEVAEEIKNTGSAKAKAFTMVTVMFTDFKDFTKVSEKVSAEMLVEEIHQCFSGFDAIIQKYKIEKIKTIGDAYLCASGLPVSNYTHAIDMVNAAIEICRFMAERKNEKEAKGEIPFELRVGIHTGPVVAGIVGVKKFAYDIWGDTVNVAARMEQNSDAGKINISGSTYELVKDKFTCTHRGKIEAKNKGEIDMYFVSE